MAKVKRITKEVAEARAGLIPESDWIEREGLSRCRNCLHVFTVDQLRDIQDFHQRVAPGEVCPSGECPDCGSLCHEIDTKKAVREFVELIARMKTEDEFGEDVPASEDWISTMNDLIAQARDLIK